MSWFRAPDDDLPWRILAAEIRRWRIPLLACAAAPLAIAVLMAWVASYDVALFGAQACLTLLTTYVGTALFRGARNRVLMQETLATPLSARSYAAPLMRLFLQLTAVLIATSMLAIACAAIGARHPMPWDQAAAALYFYCLAAAVYWGGMFGLRGLSAALSIPLLAMIAIGAMDILYFAPRWSALVASGSEYSPAWYAVGEAQNRCLQLVLLISLAAMGAFALFCGVRCYRRYDAVLLNRIP